MGKQYERGVLEKLLCIAEAKKKKGYELQKLTQEQRALIASEGMEDLLIVIDKKEMCIHAIDKLDEEFIPLYKRIQTEYENGCLDRECTALFEELEDDLQCIKDILTKIYEEDKENVDKLKDIQKEYAGNIKRINQGTKRQELYNPVHSIDGGIFIDEKQ